MNSSDLGLCGTRKAMVTNSKNKCTRREPSSLSPRRRRNSPHSPTTSKLESQRSFLAMNDCLKEKGKSDDPNPALVEASPSPEVSSSASSPIIISSDDLPPPPLSGGVVGDILKFPEDNPVLRSPSPNALFFQSCPRKTKTKDGYATNENDKVLDHTLQQKTFISGETPTRTNTTMVLNEEEEEPQHLVVVVRKDEEESTSPPKATTHSAKTVDASGVTSTSANVTPSHLPSILPPSTSFPFTPTTPTKPSASSASTDPLSSFSNSIVWSSSLDFRNLKDHESGELYQEHHEASALSPQQQQQQQQQRKRSSTRRFPRSMLGSGSGGSTSSLLSFDEWNIGSRRSVVSELTVPPFDDDDDEDSEEEEEVIKVQEEEEEEEEEGSFRIDDLGTTTPRRSHHPPLLQPLSSHSLSSKQYFEDVEDSSDSYDSTPTIHSASQTSIISSSQASHHSTPTATTTPILPGISIEEYPSKRHSVDCTHIASSSVTASCSSGRHHFHHGQRRRRRRSRHYSAPSLLHPVHMTDDDDDDDARTLTTLPSYCASSSSSTSVRVKHDRKKGASSVSRRSLSNLNSSPSHSVRIVSPPPSGSMSLSMLSSCRRRKMARSLYLDGREHRRNGRFVEALRCQRRALAIVTQRLKDEEEVVVEGDDDEEEEVEECEKEECQLQQCKIEYEICFVKLIFAKHRRWEDETLNSSTDVNCLNGDGEEEEDASTLNSTCHSRELDHQGNDSDDESIKSPATMPKKGLSVVNQARCNVHRSIAQVLEMEVKVSKRKEDKMPLVQILRTLGRLYDKKLNRHDDAVRCYDEARTVLNGILSR